MALPLPITTQVQIVRLVKALYSAAPGNTYLSAFEDTVATDGMTSFANWLAGTLSSDAATLASTMVTNLGFTGTLATEATAYMVAQFAANPGNYGRVILDTMNTLATMTADPTVGTVASAINDSVATAYAYSIDTTNTSTNLATLQAADETAAASGQTFTLTTGIDHATGTDGVDFIDGSANSFGTQTLSVNDVINGGGGNDILSATVGAGTMTTGNIDAVETFEITATGAAIFNMAGTTGYTTLANLNSTNTLAYNNINAATVQGVVRNAAGLTTFNFANSALSGSADDFKVTVEGAITTGITGSDTSGTGALETMTLVTENADVTIPTLTVTDLGLTKLVISGDKGLTITTLTDGTAGGATVKNIDASALTGDLSVTAVAAGTVTGGAGNDTIVGAAGNDILDGGAGNDSITTNAGNDSVVGGTGDDTITVAANLTVDDTIAGGDGTDKLSVALATAVGQAANVSGIETLVLSGANVTQDMDAFSTTEVTRVNTSTVNTFVINDAGDQITTLGVDGAVTATTLNRKTDGTTNALTINLGTTTAGVTAVAVTASNEETLTINSAGGSNAITTLTAADLTALTITGSKSLDIDDNAIGGGTLLATINASAFTGTALAINATNSTKSMTYTGGSNTISLTTGSGNDTVTGGTGADSVAGGTGNDSITAGTGNDTIDGGAGNDIIAGGDGEDSITAGAGNDSIDAGAGNDTIVFAANLASTDTVAGGADTDTITFSLTTTISPTLTTVEAATIDFTNTTGGAFNAGNATSLTTYTVTSANDNSTATITNIVSGATVVINDADSDTVTLDTAAAATLSLKYQAASAGATTITDVGTLNITGAVANASSASLAVDDVDTTTINVTGAAAAFTLGTGNITGTDKMTTLSVATTTAGGTATLGTVIDADSLTSLTVNAVNANATTGAIGGTGTAEVLATVSVSASGGATAQTGAITADTTDSTSDNAMVLTASSETGSTVTMGAINNQYGTITGTYTGGGAITTGAMTAVTATIGASGTTGAVAVDVSGVTGTATITFGSGAATVTETASGAATTTTITLGALNGTTDTINLDNTVTGAVNITNFLAGATNGDDIEISVGGIEGGNYVAGADDLISCGNSATSLAATNTLTLVEIAAATDMGAITGNVLVLDGDFATAALVADAVETGASHAITVNAAVTAATDLMLLIWDDGSNSYLGVLEFANDILDNGLIVAGDATVNSLITLTGVADCTTLVAANIGGTINA